MLHQLVPIFVYYDTKERKSVSYKKRTFSKISFFQPLYNLKREKRKEKNLDGYVIQVVIKTAKYLNLSSIM